MTTLREFKSQVLVLCQSTETPEQRLAHIQEFCRRPKKNGRSPRQATQELRRILAGRQELLRGELAKFAKQYGISETRAGVLWKEARHVKELAGGLAVVSSESATEGPEGQAT